MFFQKVFAFVPALVDCQKAFVGTNFQKSAQYYGYNLPDKIAFRIEIVLVSFHYHIFYTLSRFRTLTKCLSFQPRQIYNGKDVFAKLWCKEENYERKKLNTLNAILSAIYS
ncbi:hypothetical protein CAPN010_13360 [Capnocytophaga cynodegmi]|nr:hypothetical protein CAPN010_13360 [Capnocytophaga cynodegmi]